MTVPPTIKLPANPPTEWDELGINFSAVEVDFKTRLGDQFRAFRTAPLTSIPSATWTLVNLDTVHWDDGGRLVLGCYMPRQTPCRLLVTASVGLPAGQVVGAGIGIYNGSSWNYAYRIGTANASPSAGYVIPQTTQVVDVPVGWGPIGLCAYTGAGGTSALQGVGDNRVNFLEVMRVA